MGRKLEPHELSPVQIDILEKLDQVAADFAEDFKGNALEALRRRGLVEKGWFGDGWLAAITVKGQDALKRARKG